MNDGDVYIQETQLGLRRVKSKVPWSPLMVTFDYKDREETLKSCKRK